MIKILSLLIILSVAAIILLRRGRMEARHNALLDQPRVNPYGRRYEWALDSVQLLIDFSAGKPDLDQTHAKCVDLLSDLRAAGTDVQRGSLVIKKIHDQVTLACQDFRFSPKRGELEAIAQSFDFLKLNPKEE